MTCTGCTGCDGCTGGKGAGFLFSSVSLASGRLPWAEESDLRKPLLKLPLKLPWSTLLEGLVALKRTTRFRGGAGLVSRLRKGDDGREEGS